MIRCPSQHPLAGGADNSATHSGGCTPSFPASRRKHSRVFSLLLENGARSKARDNVRALPLAGAAVEGSDSIMKLLLDHGARINPAYNVGRSALHKAASHRQYTSVELLLLDQGANMSVVNHHGGTPLHDAAREGRRWTSELLPDRGAMPRMKHQAGLTPLELAPKRKVLMQHKEATSPHKLA